MTYFLVGAAVVVLLFWRGRGLKYAQWRAPAGILSIGLFVTAAFEALRGGFEPALILTALGLILLAGARWPRAAKPRGSSDGMSMVEACATLGVEQGAAPAEIRAAYSRLIRIAHPDRGGSAGLAAQLNAARDRLLKN